MVNNAIKGEIDLRSGEFDSIFMPSGTEVRQNRASHCRAVWMAAFATASLTWPMICAVHLAIASNHLHDIDLATRGPTRPVVRKKPMRGPNSITGTIPTSTWQLGSNTNPSMTSK